MSDFIKTLDQELSNLGLHFFRFVNISALPKEQTLNFPQAILIGKYLDVESLSKQGFNDAEADIDSIADSVAKIIENLGYSSFSQSEPNLIKHGKYDSKTKQANLPHKTIGSLSGIGWIGKNNLLLIRDNGCAICISSILTDAPLESKAGQIHGSSFRFHPSLCKSCTICRDICPTGALTGNEWQPGHSREELIDVFKCIACLKCITNCPWS